MTEIESYPKSPITEAIFEILTEFPKSVAATDIEKLHSKISAQYPKAKPRHKFESRFEVKDGKPVNSETISLGVDGYLFWTQDDKQVVQYRANGFSFSRLNPYQKWDVHFPEVIKLWEIFSSELKPSKVVRTAVRFINRIEVPELQFDMGKYLRCPLLAPNVGHDVSIENFVSRIQFSFPENGIKTNLTQTLGTRTNPNMTPIILDLDIYLDVRYEPDVEQIKQAFIKLRAIKNTIFKNSITEKTEELFR